MRRLLTTLLTTVTAAASLAVVGSAVPFGGRPAGAATHACTAWAALPARVALDQRQSTLWTTLRGDAGCATRTYDNGASATLRGPRGEHPYGQRWAHFGARDSMAVVVGITKLGRYSIQAGDVQLYDADERRMPATWRATSTVVKQAAAVRASRAGSRGSGNAGHYSPEGWIASRHARVAVQEHTASGWRTVSRTTTDSRGRFALGGAQRGYRVAVAGTASSWGAATTVR